MILGDLDIRQHHCQRFVRPALALPQDSHRLRRGGVDGEMKPAEAAKGNNFSLMQRGRRLPEGVGALDPVPVPPMPEQAWAADRTGDWAGR